MTAPKTLSPAQLASLQARLQRLGLHGVAESTQAPHAAAPVSAAAVSGAALPALGLIFFSDIGDGSRGLYDLVLEASSFADEAGFQAVWTPERHFQVLGGPYPNPAVLGAAIAARTRRLRVRAGAVNLPLHDPLRVAEEWAVVDHLSHGRVDLAFAPGWHPGDFILQPANFERRREIATESLREVQRLWRGDSVRRRDPMGRELDVLTYPRPMQPELHAWITISHNSEAWVMAGSLGLNVLTALINHGMDGLAERIALYRRARSDAGYDPDAGVVTLMLHTYVAEPGEDARERVYPALSDYLASFLSQQDKLNNGPRHSDVRAVVEEDPQAFVDFVVERYYATSSLVGSPERCVAMLQRVAAIGVNEVACLIDFGLDHDSVMGSLARLAALRAAHVERTSNRRSGKDLDAEAADALG